MRSRDTKPDESISIAHTDQKTSISFTTGCNNQTISINDAWSKTSDDNLGTWCGMEGADTLSRPNGNDNYIKTLTTEHGEDS